MKLNVICLNLRILTHLKIQILKNSKNIRKRKLKQDDYTYKNLYDANDDPPASQESVANSNVDDKINNFNYIIEGEAEPIK